MGWGKKKLSSVSVIEKVKHDGSLMNYVGLEHIESNTGKFVDGIKPKSVASSTFRFNDEHVLYGRLRPYLNKVSLPDFEGHCSTEIFPIKTLTDLDREFLFYWLSMPSTVEKINGTCTGARMPRANMKEVMEFDIPVPPLEEQKKIVAILEQAFAEIDKARANAEQNLSNACELFDSYLNQVFSQRGEGWEEKKLGDVVELAQGLAINRKTKHLLVDNSNLPLLRIKDLKSGTAEQFVAEDGFPKKSAVDVEDLIYTRTGQIGLVFMGRKGVLHNNCFKITPNNEVLRKYLYWFLQVPSFKQKIIRLASRVAQPDITHKLFKEQNIVFPNIDIQEKLIELAEILQVELKALESIYKAKLNSLEELKKSILQKAFSGELTG